MIEIVLSLHVGAGTLWVFSTIAIAVSGAARRWLCALQIFVALVAVGAGIDLWHTLHAGRDGPVEHMLATGTFCALIALGLQIALTLSLLGAAQTGADRLERRALALHRGSAVLLLLAATAMVASRYS